ncbi:transmembrane and TPR repeat-containing protein 2-like [Elysia marginata]|uniref:dolichyl-phosphate-mannose--protein mannosyltransferase n=1 Tax=Elysia marginata TaxID=1093978 RepID=A0AAV4HKG5_9GAST|nr:transmembrane and TPR repeat-containing protein 2-like [Elysia marginata]
MDYALPSVTALLAAVLYINTLSAGFAYDDSRAIQKNPDLLPETPLWNLAYDDFWGTPLTHSGSHKSYRPLCVLTFRLNYLLGELSPWGYHLGNVICHAVTTAIFTLLAQKLFAGSGGVSRSFQPDGSGEIQGNGCTPGASLLSGLLDASKIGPATAGLLFAAHPVHTEAVAGVVGRADVLACMFFLLTFLSYSLYVSCRHSDQPGSRVVPALLTVLLAAASMLTKEHAITVLAVCVVYDVLVVHRATPRDIFSLAVLTQARFRRALEGVALLAVCGCSLLGFRIYFMGNKPPEFAPSDNPASDSDSLLTRTLTYNFLPAANFWLVLCPRLLSFDWSMEAVPLVESLSDMRNLATAGFYASLVFLVFKVIKALGDCEDSGENGHKSDLSYNSHQNNRDVSMSSNGKNGVHNNITSHNNNHTSTSQKVQQNGLSNGGRAHNGKAATVHKNGHARTLSSIPSSIIPSSFRSVDVVVLSTAMIVFPFIPASNMFFYVGFVLAERVLYMPSMGVCLLVGLGVHSLYNRVLVTNSRHRCLVLVILAILLASFSAKTVLRNRDWQTEENLYKAGVAVNPAKAWGNLANIFNDKQESENAEEAYRNALKYRPNMADVHYNLGILLQNQKRYTEAIESYNKAIHFRPKLSAQGLKAKEAEAHGYTGHSIQWNP